MLNAETLQSREIIADYFLQPELVDDTTTWLAEVLDGQMRSSFEYRFDGRELYGRDGRALKSVFSDGVDTASRLARHQPNFAFEVRRRQLEMDEYKEMLCMARGEAPNTMVVISDFPAELMGADEDVGGYNVSRRQTMLRVISVTAEDSLVITSQSLDYSERTALEAIYQSLGFRPQAGELLGQRMHLDWSPTEHKQLIDQLTTVYDTSLTARYGGEWRAGRPGRSDINTYDFVCAQTDLLAAYCHQPTRDNLVNLAAAMRGRLQSAEQGTQVVWPLWSIEQTQLEMNSAGHAARMAGEVYSGCGMSLNADKTESALAQMQALGYGNQATESSNYKFDKFMHCLVCQAPPQKSEPKKMCGPCGICKACDTNFRKKNK